VRSVSDGNILGFSAIAVFVILLSVLGLSACISHTHTLAPIGRIPSYSEPIRSKDGYHLVKRGENLYAIAMRYGLDYRQLAKWNDIKSPSFLIRPGQELRLSPSLSKRRRTPKPRVVPRSILRKPLPPSGNVSSSRNRPPPKKSAPSRTSALPRGPYSSKSTRNPPQKNIVRKKPKTVTRTVPSKRRKTGAGSWHWPSPGRLVRNFVQSSKTGLDISDRFGAPVYATAPGRVVYTGSGLRGYGKLIIVKHNAQYLSAYANNSRMLVQEGNKVSGGQKIAEMGKDGTNRPVLHFEIRKNGKPVDPLLYLGKPFT